MKKILLLICMIACSTGLVNAQKDKRPETYNYQRGVEAITEEKYAEAINYLNQEVSENPKNGYAFSWIAYVLALYKDNGKALDAVDLALKYIPKKDKEYVTFAYGTRAMVQLNLNDTTNALISYGNAIKADPENTDLYEKRAQVYYELKQYDYADADYYKMTTIKPGDIMGYMGLGRNANARKQWNDAIERFNYVERLSPTYSSVHAFRAEAYQGLNDWNKCTDDIVAAMEEEWDNKAMAIASELDEQQSTLLISKMKVKQAGNPNSITWPYAIGIIYESNNQYSKAVEAYNKANEVEVSPVTLYHISGCYEAMGENLLALDAIDKAINIDDTDTDYLRQKASVLYELGRKDEVLATCDKMITLSPEAPAGYYSRAWYRQLYCNYDDAIEDITTAIVLLPDYYFYYIIRANIYQLAGKDDMAKEDYRKAIELEKEDEDTRIYYAYQAIGDKQKAIELMDKSLARKGADEGDLYEAACLYARMNEKQKAIGYLEQALQNGYRHMTHIEHDHDLDNIRQMPEFKELIRKYDYRGNYQQAKTDDDEEQQVQVDGDAKEIPFTKENGVCKVKCDINGLPLHFVFDTGASTVSISMVEATFMFKNGYLSKNDIIGSQNFMDANGNISVGTVIMLRSVKFGGEELTNVRASVVSNQVAPLLLGQSVLGRLGRIEIDNRSQVIRISNAMAAPTKPVSSPAPNVTDPSTPSTPAPPAAEHT